LLQSQGRLNDAIEQYSEAVKLRPDTPLMRLNLGMALRTAGRPDNAIQELKQVIAAYPDNLKARSQLAATYQDKNMHQQAVNQ
jgi:predicted Zn-dependent protease